MRDTPDLDDLILAWEESQSSDNPQTPEQICADHPDLLESLRKRIAELQWVNRLLGSDSDTRLEAVTAGMRVGRYQLLELLGEGGFGQVWKGYDPQLERHVAVKLLHPQRRKKWGQLGHVVAEARSLARLRHPNIVSVYDAGQDLDTAFLVTEWIDGESLQSWLRRRRTTLDQALSIARSIGHALEHAHSAGTIHRDVKPGNILIARGGQAFLTDFGIASSPSTSESSSPTWGTPGYMSPEQAGVIEDPISPASDVFGLGQVLLTMLLGPEQIGHSREDLSDRERFLRQSLSERGVTAALAEVCLTATAWKPQDRYSSAAEFIAAIDQCTGHDVRPRTGPKWTTMILALALFFVVLAMGGLYVWRPKDVTSDRSGKAAQAAGPHPDLIAATSRIEMEPYRVTMRVWSQVYIGGLGEGLSPLADTTLPLDPGQHVKLTASGRWKAGPKPGEDAGAEYLTAAVGEVGKSPGQFFVVNDGIEFDVQAPGNLFLGTNDSRYSDNSGELIVTVVVSGAVGPERRYATKQGDLVGSRMVGAWGGGSVVCSRAPEGADLVGIDAAMGWFQGYTKHHVVGGIRPIWERKGQQMMGEPLGEWSDEVISRRAPPGYVISGIHPPVAGRFETIHLLYSKKGTTSLPADDDLWLDPIGLEDGKHYHTLGGDGDPIVAITAIADPQLRGLGVIQQAALDVHSSSLAGHVFLAGFPYRYWRAEPWEFVGLRVYVGDVPEPGRSEKVILGIRPVYRDQGRVEEGPILGSEAADNMALLAPEGCVLDGLSVHTSDFILGLRIRYARAGGGGSSDDHQWSAWMGMPTETGMTVEAPDAIPNGLRGCAQRAVRSVGLVRITAMAK